MQTSVTCPDWLHWWDGCGKVIIPYKQYDRDISLLLGCTKNKPKFLSPPRYITRTKCKPELPALIGCISWKVVDKL